MIRRKLRAIAGAALGLILAGLLVFLAVTGGQG